MKYLLDTNAIIAIMKGQEGFLARLRQHRPTDFCVSPLVMLELYYGAYHSQRVEQNLKRIAALRFEVLGFSLEDARCAGELRAELAAQGVPIGPIDLLIAAQARARELVVVTHNLKEFQRVPQLRVEDWEIRASPSLPWRPGR